MVAQIIYQDKNFIAVNKPAGMLTHATAVSHRPTSGTIRQEEILTDYLVKKFPEIKNVGDEPLVRPGIVHRLDKDTSGVILIARNQIFFDYLKNIFQSRAIKKTYLALTWGEIKGKTGVIEKIISLKPGSVKRTVHRGKQEKSAVTEYRVIKNLILKTLSGDKQSAKNRFSLLEVSPKTGRTHQIRIHLSSIGHPIVGDNLYGPKHSGNNRANNPFGLKRQFLHAQSVEFNTAEGRRVKIEADLPAELDEALEKCRPA